MIDRFTKMEFEAALPAVGGQTLWTSLGLRDREQCYLIPVKPGVVIFVRSTVDASGIAADVAEDSIRCWLAKNDSGEPLGSKEERWIARTKNWRKRLLETLRTLWSLGRKIGNCSCGTQMLALKVRDKSSKNFGRWFSKCPSCRKFGVWLSETEKPKTSKASSSAPV